MNRSQKKRKNRAIRELYSPIPYLFEAYSLFTGVL